MDNKVPHILQIDSSGFDGSSQPDIISRIEAFRILKNRQKRKLKSMANEIKETKKQLKQKIVTLQSQIPSSYVSALRNIENCGNDKYTGSGVILTLTDFNGNPIVYPVCITDGLEPETINALKEEIRNCLHLTLSLNKV